MSLQKLIDGEVARLEKVVRQIDKTKKGDLDVTLKLQEWVKADKVRCFLSFLPLLF